MKIQTILLVFMFPFFSFAESGFKKEPKTRTIEFSGFAESYKSEDGEVKVVIAEDPARYRLPKSSEKFIAQAAKSKKKYTWIVDAYNRKIYEIK